MVITEGHLAIRIRSERIRSVLRLAWKGECLWEGHRDPGDCIWALLTDSINMGRQRLQKTVMHRTRTLG